MDHVDYKLIGRQVSRLRRKKDLTQAQLAEILDISVQHVSNIETGRTQLSLPCLVDISEHFHEPLSYFLYNAEKPDDPLLHKQIAELLSGCNEATATKIIRVLFALRDELQEGK